MVRYGDSSGFPNCEFHGAEGELSVRNDNGTELETVAKAAVYLGVSSNFL